MGLHQLRKFRDKFHFARESIRLQPELKFVRLAKWTVFEIEPWFNTRLPEPQIGPPPAWGQRHRHIDGLAAPVNRDLNPLGRAIHFAVMILEIAKGPHRRSVHLRYPVPGLDPRALGSTTGLF